MEYHVLASGSKGNSVFIYENGSGLLIDCGISRKQLLYKLKQLGFAEKDIQYVLLTHDHYDHNKNISIFDLHMVYCGCGCIKNIDHCHEFKDYEMIKLGGFEITPLPLSHDATSPFGFVIKGARESLLYMTDTGYVSQKNLSYMHDLEYYIFESNHDVEMLMATKRPLFLKNRIYGDKGHLNNEYSANIMAQVIGPQTKEICLAHLSQEANTPEMALATYHRVFKERNVDFSQIKVASQVDVVSGGQHEN